MTPHTDAHPPKPYMAVIRPFTTRVFNPFSRLFVRWLPGFGVLVYRGRKSGALYRTPMNAFERDGDWIFALTYSSDVQWVRNVLAAGEADLQRGGATIHLVEPRLFVDPPRARRTSSAEARRSTSSSRGCSSIPNGDSCRSRSDSSWGSCASASS